MLKNKTHLDLKKAATNLSFQVMLFSLTCCSRRQRLFSTFTLFIILGLITQVIIYYLLTTLVIKASRSFTLHSTEESIVLIRAIGNDIPPFHSTNESYSILKFILENEHEYENLKKHWVINKIVDSNTLEALVKLFEKHHQNYTIIPFNLTEYQQIPLQFHNNGYGKDILHDQGFWKKANDNTKKKVMDSVLKNKNIYVLNANGARNFMLRIGINMFHGDWILPWDGNCFLTSKAWKEIKQSIATYGPLSNYLSVPTQPFLILNNDLLNDKFSLPSASGEPQLIFHKSAQGKFDERLQFGNHDKAELLSRLGIYGKWYKEWKDVEEDEDVKNSVTDIKANRTFSHNESELNIIPNAGYIPQLVLTDDREKENNNTYKKLLLMQGIENLVENLDLRAARTLNDFSAMKLIYYDENVLTKEKSAFLKGSQNDSKLIELIKKLITVANKSLTVGPWSVTDKKDYLAPSNDPKDYFHPPPYDWPDLDKTKRIRYQRRDGMRAPGTEMYGEFSERYDRTRLAAMQFNTTVLTLAWYFTNYTAYAEKAVNNLRAWFLNPKTSMNPHLLYAQATKHEGSPAGVIEMKDNVFMLDAARLLFKTGMMNEIEFDQLKAWYGKYLDYLITSGQGQFENNKWNNHGLYYDIHLVSVASFVNETRLFMKTMFYGASRMYRQISVNGMMSMELARSTCEHYQMFTLEGWLTMNRIASKIGLNYWQIEDERVLANESELPLNKQYQKKPILCKASKYAIPYLRLRKGCNDYPEIVDEERWLPLWYEAVNECPQLHDLPLIKILQKNVKNKTGFEELPVIPKHHYEMKPIYHEHDGIPPFWNLGYKIYPE